MTVLGELLLPHGGEAWTQTLIDAMRCVNVSEKATRQLLTRSEDRKWLVRSRTGRRTRWHLTDGFAAVLAEGAERIYRHGVEFETWDGRWSVAIVSVPDGEGDRHRLTRGLQWNGYGSLRNGVWICPRVGSETEAARTISESGVREPVLFRAEVGALGDDLALAHRAWPLDQLSDAYEAFGERWKRSLDLAWPVEDRLVGDLIRLVDRWRRFPLTDPGLPRQLLPDDWPASSAAERFSAARATYAGPASEWWLAREERYGRN